MREGLQKSWDHARSVVPSIEKVSCASDICSYFSQYIGLTSHNCIIAVSVQSYPLDIFV